MSFRNTERQLIIEVDGPSGGGSPAEQTPAARPEQDDCLVLRFCDEEVRRDMQSVLDRIAAAVARIDCPLLRERERDVGG